MIGLLCLIRLPDAVASIGSDVYCSVSKRCGTKGTKSQETLLLILSVTCHHALYHSPNPSRLVLSSAKDGAAKNSFSARSPADSRIRTGYAVSLLDGRQLYLGSSISSPRRPSMTEEKGPKPGPSFIWEIEQQLTEMNLN